MASDVTEPVWIQAAPYGSYSTATTDYTITPEKATRMVENFNNNVRGHDIALDYDHRVDVSKGNKASGWVRGMETRDDGLYWLVAWTPQASGEIRAGEWKYFSAEWIDEWEHPGTHTKHKDVALGGGLTNRPMHKGRLPINASEIVLETDMGDEPTAQKPDGMEATPNQPTEPDQVIDIPKHKEPGTAPDMATPPHPADDDPNAKVDTGTQEGNVVKLDELRKKLGLPDDADEAAVMAAIDGITKEVEPLRKVAHDFDKKAKFAAEYPEEAARLGRLDQESKERRATEFAGQFEKISDTEGLSPVAREQLEQAHMAAENGTLDSSGLANAISAVTNRDNIVTFGEQGSSRDSGGGSTEDFAEKIKSIQASDNLSYSAAVQLAAEKHPDLYAAYRESIVHVQGGSE
jgi:phage I-like protein